MIQHALLHAFRALIDHAHLIGVLAVGLAVLAVFVSWERRGRGILVVFTILAVLLLDATLYPTTGAMTLGGLFHPFIVKTSFRTIQLLIVLGLAARLFARGFPRRIDTAAMLWTAFFVWYTTAAVIGLLDGHDRHLVTSRAFFALETGGLAVLAAGVPARDYLDARGLPRFLPFAGLVAGVDFVLAEAGVRIGSNFSQLPLVDFGQMGADASTIFPALGFIGLAMELTQPRRRPLVLVASGLCLLAPLASPQRAARLGILVTLAVFLAFLLWPRRRRFRARGGDWVLAGLVLAAVVATPIFVRSVAGGRPPSIEAAIPFSHYTVQAVRSDYRQGSVQSRYNEWAAARPLIRHEPVFGNGLGTTFVHYEPGTREFVTYDLTNNIALDLLVRTGAVGLALFVGAAAASLAAAWRAWRHAPDDVVSLVAGMTGAVLAGFLGKGMVESVLNEYHMTPLLGFLLGLVATFAVAARRPAGSARRPRPAGSA